MLTTPRFLRSGSFTSFVVLLLALLLTRTLCLGAQEVPEPGVQRIESYQVTGNTIMGEAEIGQVLQPFIGLELNQDNLEKARKTLEQTYRTKGYPGIQVNSPEQTGEGGLIRLEAVESTIRRVRVTGNQYFTMESIKNDLPSLALGNQLFVPQLQIELNRINRNRNLKVAPVLLPGKEPGTIDVELKVKDRLPLHGSLELNNRSSHDTSNLRFNGSARYENLWQMNHSFPCSIRLLLRNFKRPKLWLLPISSHLSGVPMI
jgi:hemolysin activation/secretion protein